jgi:hypothetical protein
LPVDNLTQLLAWQPVHKEFIIDQGILQPGTRMILFGSPKTWKSMSSIHTGFCLATGTDWFGYHTNKQAVLIYQVELPKLSFRNRIEKYNHNILGHTHSIFFETAQRVKLDTSYGLAAIQKSIAEVKARCPNLHLTVILDPVYKLMSGNVADEQDTKRFIDNCDSLIDKEDIALILVHHSRKAKYDDGGKQFEFGSEDMFGGELQKWCDTAVSHKLLNPFGAKNKVKVSFDLTRNADSILNPFDITWSRTNLLPEVTRTYAPESDEPITNTTVRDLIA